MLFEQIKTLMTEILIKKNPPSKVVLLNEKLCSQVAVIYVSDGTQSKFEWHFIHENGFSRR